MKKVIKKEVKKEKKFKTAREYCFEQINGLTSYIEKTFSKFGKTIEDTVYKINNNFEIKISYKKSFNMLNISIGINGNIIHSFNCNDAFISYTILNIYDYENKFALLRQEIIRKYFIKSKNNPTIEKGNFSEVSYYINNIITFLSSIKEQEKI